jgi:hypothetical protein
MNSFHAGHECAIIHNITCTGCIPKSNHSWCSDFSQCLFFHSDSSHKDCQNYCPSSLIFHTDSCHSSSSPSSDVLTIVVVLVGLTVGCVVFICTSILLIKCIGKRLSFEQVIAEPVPLNVFGTSITTMPESALVLGQEYIHEISSDEEAAPMGRITTGTPLSSTKVAKSVRLIGETFYQGVTAMGERLQEEEEDENGNGDYDCNENSFDSMEEIELDP